MKKIDLLRLGVYSHLSVIVMLTLWIYDPSYTFIYYIDKQIFLFLNNLLTDNNILQTIFGLLNHKKETKLNLLFMAFLNILSIVLQKSNNKKCKATLYILYFWGFFQIGFMLQDWYFNTYLTIDRLSPSVVLTPYILLSEVLNNSQIKDISYNCFPSGHALSLSFWLIFSVYYMPNKTLKIITLLIGLFMFFPRLVGGAHWMSDAVFSIGLSLCWMAWALFILKVLEKLKKTTDNSFNFI